MSSVGKLAKKLFRVGSAGSGAHIKGLVAVHDDFLSSDDFQALREWAAAQPCPRTREDLEWSHHIKQDFAECHIGERFSSHPETRGGSPLPPGLKMFWDALRVTAGLGPDDMVDFLVYRWQRLSGIGLHTDAHAIRAATFYLNDQWDVNWGGDFVYYETIDDAKRGYGRTVLPKPNRLLLNENSAHHKVTYCSTMAPERITLQAFIFPARTD